MNLTTRKWLIFKMLCITRVRQLDCSSSSKYPLCWRVVLLVIVAMLFPTQSLVAQPSALNDLLKKAATAQDAQATVKNAIFLHGGRMSSIAMNGGVSQGLLARELLRQSLLLAAREDFQLETYDSNLVPAFSRWRSDHPRPSDWQTRR